MIIEQHECLEEEGTRELIALTKAALNTKLNSNDANISNGTITIKGQSITPVTEQYTLPPATNSTLGGIIVGNNLTIDTDGVLSANSGGYTLPIASSQTLGGIKVGNNLSIDPITGVLSATGGGGGVTVDDHIDGTSENPVQNKVIKATLDDKLDKTDATIASGVITIQEHQLVPMTPAEVTTMWNNTTPT
jgi:hypothetical protein